MERIQNMSESEMVELFSKSGHDALKESEASYTGINLNCDCGRKDKQYQPEGTTNMVEQRRQEDNYDRTTVDTIAGRWYDLVRRAQETIQKEQAFKSMQQEMMGSAKTGLNLQSKLRADIRRCRPIEPFHALLYGVR